MPRFLRVGIREGHWFTSPDIGWLPAGQLQADVFLDLRTEGNRLSVFEVGDGDELDLIQRIAVAVAVGRKEPDHIGFTVFDRARVDGMGIEVQQTPGRTMDVAINQLHFDLLHLTAQQLMDLAGLIVTSEIDILYKPLLIQLARAGIAVGRLDPANMTSEWRRAVAG
ncbi:MAG: hypothetical protein ACRD2L_08945 [Terriglobia bacterium]